MASRFASFKASFTSWAATPVVAMALVVAHAPLQCGREADPAYRREDTPGDALWDLAAAFRAKGDEKSARETLQFLVEKYPSSRYAMAAKEQLAAPASVAPATSATPPP